MAKLRNNLPHMVGQTVKVNGEIYQIDGSGVVEINDQTVVDKLLTNKAAWSLVSGTEEKPKPKKEKASVPTKTIVRKPVNEQKEKPSEEPKEEEGKIRQWPDPTPDLPIGYLRQMADAYAVDYTIKTPKAELIDRINKAMYGEAE